MNIKNLNNIEGQALLEFMFAFFGLFICFVSVVEIERLISFKNSLQSATSFVAHEIAYSQIDLLQRSIISQDDGNVVNKNELLNKKISSEIENELIYFQTSHFSFDNKNEFLTSKGIFSNDNFVLSVKKNNVRVRIRTVQNSPELPSGVYIHAQTCLPVLFASFFRHIESDFNVGKSVKDDSRSCLGYINNEKSLPLFWFSIRVAAYSPWPSSTQIFQHGIAEPTEFFGIDTENKNKILKSIYNHKLTEYFLNVSK